MNFQNRNRRDTCWNIKLMGGSMEWTELDLIDENQMDEGILLFFAWIIEEICPRTTVAVSCKFGRPRRFPSQTLGSLLRELFNSSARSSRTLRQFSKLFGQIFSLQSSSVYNRSQTIYLPKRDDSWRPFSGLSVPWPGDNGLWSCLPSFPSLFKNDLVLDLMAFATVKNLNPNGQELNCFYENLTKRIP